MILKNIQLHDEFLKVFEIDISNRIGRCFKRCMIFCEVKLISFRHAIYHGGRTTCAPHGSNGLRNIRVRSKL